jgi:hypothetical protein
MNIDNKKKIYFRKENSRTKEAIKCPDSIKNRIPITAREKIERD